MIRAKPDNCFYCAKKIRRKGATVDHVHPTSRGGTESRRNKVWACWKCNQDKGNLSLEEFRLVVSYRLGLIPAAPLLFPGESINGKRK